jgi:hypothetical protein
MEDSFTKYLEGNKIEYFYNIFWRYQMPKRQAIIQLLQVTDQPFSLLGGL